MVLMAHRARLVAKWPMASGCTALGAAERELAAQYRGGNVLKFYRVIVVTMV